MPKPSETRFAVTPLALPEVLRVSGPQFTDDRGTFLETFRENEFAQLGIRDGFVQENMSLSVSRGTIRGLHFQAPPHAQAKLVRAVSGSIFDVAVDLRRGSPNFGRWCGATLTAGKNECIYVPRGFAHGFCCLEENTAVAYKVDSYYDRASEGGIVWNDVDVGIEWQVGGHEVKVSEKDGKLPRLAEIASPFEYGR